MDTGLVRANGHVRSLDLRGLRRAVASGIVSSREGVDLSGVDFVTPGGMVGLACLIEGWALEWNPVPLVPPADEVAGYMARMDLFKHLGSKISLGRSLSHLEDRSRYPAPLSEVRKVHTPGDVTVVTAQFGSILRSCGVGEAEVQHCCQVLSESLTNVLNHAESPCGAYTAIQKWDKRNEVCVAVADAGLGIPATIRDLVKAQGAASADHELIRVALEPGVSRRPGAGWRGPRSRVTERRRRQREDEDLVKQGLGRVPGRQQERGRGIGARLPRDLRRGRVPTPEYPRVSVDTGLPLL